MDVKKGIKEIGAACNRFAATRIAQAAEPLVPQPGGYAARLAGRLILHRSAKAATMLAPKDSPRSTTEGCLADKSTRLILEALTRAASEPAGLPLFGSKAAPRLFPTTSAARHAAQRCKEDGYLQPVGDAPRELCTITEKGRAWLVQHTSPRQVLEDFVRVLEERRHQAAELIAAAQHIASSVESLKSTVELLRPEESHHLNGERGASAPCSPGKQGADTPGSPGDDIPTLLEQWHAAAPGDCPLPELYRRLSESHPKLTVGCFHDALRELHGRGSIYLHPWTGPLYDLPDPPFALMTGHEIAYYASGRTESG